MHNILILNAGSSSLKFKLFQHNNDKFSVITEGQFSKINDNNPTFVIKVNGKKTSKDFESKLSMAEILDIINKQLKSDSNLEIHAIGHRVVHGGDIYTQPTIVTKEVIENLKSIIYLTPIHLPHNIAPMEVCENIFPNITQVACFDTAFHSTIDKLHSTYAIPRELTENDKIKRYGFHGLSYEYLVNELSNLDADIADKKIVLAHLGAGASITAVNNKKSIDTTMGLTPLEGLVMGTRCGSIDPSIVLYLMQKGLDYKAITDVLYFKSGLLGVSKLTPDFSTISYSEDKLGKEAYLLFVNSVVKNILGMASSLEGIDALVFSGGIGENSFKLRKDVLEKLSWLGVAINETANNNGKSIISSESSKVKCFVIPTQEELVIATHTYKLVSK